MASVVQGTERQLRSRARSAPLRHQRRPARAGAPLVGGDRRRCARNGALAREFWRRYARSPEVRDPIDAAKIEASRRGIVPYIANKFERVDQPEWTEPGASLCRARARQRADAVDPARRGQRRDRGRLRRDAPQGQRRGRAGSPRAHPVRPPGDRDRRLHPPRHHDHPRRKQGGAGPARPPTFNQKVLGVVQNCTRESEQLRAQAADTSASARGMLGKTSEVAAAAEQSAVAMREAAQTAAGLIRAIEDARNEVEVAAGVATRAGGQAEPGGQGQPGAVGPCRGDRIDPRPDPRHRRPDQFARAQRHHRGGARRRCRPRLRGRRAGSEEPRQPDRARDRRHHRQDHRHPARHPPDGRGQRLDPVDGRGGPDLGRPHPPGDGDCRRRR